jgi:penicillin-binding protein 1A
MLVGVWVGYDEKHPLGDKETGGRVAAPIWLEFMRAALGETPVQGFSLPEGIVFVHINPRTGQRALPGSQSAILECFRRGTEPQAFTEIAATSKPLSQPPARQKERIPDRASGAVAAMASVAVQAVEEGF